MTRAPRRLELVEFAKRRLPAAEFTDELARILWPQYTKQVTLEWPSYKTQHHWELKPEGWVGYIPLTADTVLELQPKVSIANLFRMLEYAYRLKGLQFPQGQIECTSLAEFYELLASLLALRILDRERIGLYRAYLSRSERAMWVRGRVDMPSTLRRAWKPDLECSFEEHTPDVEENQILVWTLYQILRGGLCSERVLPTIRRAYRGLQGLVTLQHTTARACIGRLYSRLSSDYEPLHALCRFFLEQTGPGHAWGDRRMLPFLIDMSQLYELFVAEWLKHHLPSNWRLHLQERVEIGTGHDLHFKIDLVLYDATSGKPLAILDTKYKDAATPAVDDIQQVVTYAVSKGCPEAVLVYPIPLGSFNETIGGAIRVSSVSFRLDQDVEGSGKEFLAMLERRLTSV